MRKKCLYMVVTHDEYELPLIVSEDIKEIAEYTGCKVSAILSMISHYEAGRRKKGVYRRVLLDETI